jgi:hypothetical protein
MPPEGASAASPLAAVVAINGYPRAKQGLIDRGRPREEVEAMPIPQVILLYTVETYEEIRDEGFKWMLLPYSESHSALQRWEKELGERAKSREVLPLASLLLPAVNAARLGVVRNDRDLAALQACEAIRLYAAAHDGRLPERLSDMDVPVPANPITGQPFAYRRTGETAVLEVSGFPGDAQRWRSFQYEIKIAPKGK